MSDTELSEHYNTNAISSVFIFFPVPYQYLDFPTLQIFSMDTLLVESYRAMPSLQTTEPFPMIGASLSEMFLLLSALGVAAFRC
jgi:hypothetical protein